MALKIQTKSEGGGTFQEVPKGTYAAKLVDVVDEGFREDRFAKEPGGKKLEYRFTYLLSELMSDGRPFVISEWIRIARMNADGSVSRGALFKSDGKMSNFVARVEALTGMDLEAVGITRFDDELELAEWLIGKACMVQVTINAKGKSRVSGVMALPRGMHAPTGDYVRKRDRGQTQASTPIYAPGRNAQTLPGEPSWFTEVVTAGKFKGRTWSDMAQGSVGGARHHWCEWIQSKDAASPEQEETKRRAAMVLAIYRGRSETPNDDPGEEVF